MQPLMFVLLFAYVFGGAIDVDGGGYREYLIGGILIQSLAFAMIGPATVDRHRPARRRHRPVPLAAGPALCLPARPLLRRAARIDPVDRRPAGYRAHRRLAHPRPVSCTWSRRSLLLLVFASAMIWLGTWLGMLVRSPDAVMGIGFVVVFPAHVLSQRVRADRVVARTCCSGSPRSTRSACWSPRCAHCSATRSRRSTKHVWPIDHPVAAAWIYCVVLLALGWVIAQRRYKARTTD